MSRRDVLITEAGDATLTDFGVARALWGDATISDSGLFRGTPAYVAPEVARGAKPLPAADVFSLGSTLFAAALARGRRPAGRAGAGGGLNQETGRTPRSRRTQPPVRGRRRRPDARGDRRAGRQRPQPQPLPELLFSTTMVPPDLAVLDGDRRTTCEHPPGCNAA